MEYFYLVYGVMGLRILAKLIESGNAPGLIISHRTYNFEKSETDFYEPLQKLALENNINIIFTDNISEHSPELSKYKIGICAGFMEILRNDVFDAPEFGILNLHCGKLPYYKGRAPISRCIINGDKELTVTMHKIEKGVDSGDVFLTDDIKILPKDDVNSIYDKCCDVSFRLINHSLKIINTISSKTFYYEMLVPQLPENIKANKSISKEERKIDRSELVYKIYDLIRALYPPYPSAFFVYKGKEYFVEKSFSKKDDSCKSEGKILSVESSQMTIEFKRGILTIEKLSDGNSTISDFKNYFTEGEYID